jgi:hypothetical protein
MNVALILFAVAAVGGIVLALIRFKGKPYPPMALALVHGAVAAAGLVALIALVAQHQGTSSATTRWCCSSSRRSAASPSSSITSARSRCRSGWWSSTRW